MDARISMITLGVKDVKIARAFYEEGLGWTASSISNSNFVAFQMKYTVLCLYNESCLAEDATVKFTPQTGFRGFTLAYNVKTKAEVTQVLEQVKSIGATIVKAPQDVFWGGFSGYFADPDGHLWEVAFNPYCAIADDGALQLPK